MARSLPSWTTFVLWGFAVFQLITLVLAIPNPNDLEIFLDASQELVDGGNVYTIGYRQGYRFFYGLAFAYVIAPLNALPLALAKMLWGLLGMVLLWRSYRIVAAWAGLDTWPLERQRLVQAIAALVLLQAVRDNLNTCQASFVLLWCCLEGIEQALRGRPVLAAVIVAFGIDMKLLPLIVVPYWVYRATWRPLLVLPFALALWVAAPLLLTGKERGADMLRSRVELLNPTDKRHVLDDEEPDFIALGSLISAYGGGDHVRDYGVTLPRRVVRMTDEQVGKFTWLARLVLGLGMVIVLRLPPFRPAPSGLQRACEVGYLLASIPLIFPHQQNYAMLYMAPAVLYLAMAATEAPPSRAPGKGVLIAGALLLLGANVHLLFGSFFWFHDHYKLLSFTLLFVLVLLVRARPGATALQAPIGKHGDEQVG
ncbi:MAG: DUF2029 domain-containing protein [Flavobacteriales bacterium]|nr:DUF2029 domain-containing protein [Flavobacteriales bacterium]